MRHRGGRSGEQRGREKLTMVKIQEVVRGLHLGGIVS